MIGKDIGGERWSKAQSSWEANTEVTAKSDSDQCWSQKIISEVIFNWHSQYGVTSL